MPASNYNVTTFLQSYTAWTLGDYLIQFLSVDTMAQTYLRMKFYRGYSYVSISLVRYSVLILNKVVMTNWNVDYTVDYTYLYSFETIFDPNLDKSPNSSLLSPFASNGGY